MALNKQKMIEMLTIKNTLIYTLLRDMKICQGILVAFILTKLAQICYNFIEH